MTSVQTTFLTCSLSQTSTPLERKILTKTDKGSLAPAINNVSVKNKRIIWDTNINVQVKERILAKRL